MNKKKLIPVNVQIDSTDNESVKNALDNALSTIKPDSNVVNLIKIHTEDITYEQLHTIIKELFIKPLKKLGVSNCLFVPVHPHGFITDVTIDYIAVKDETNN